MHPPDDYPSTAGPHCSRYLNLLLPWLIFTYGVPWMIWKDMQCKNLRILRLVLVCCSQIFQKMEREENGFVFLVVLALLPTLAHVFWLKDEWGCRFKSELVVVECKNEKLHMHVIWLVQLGGCSIINHAKMVFFLEFNPTCKINC